jgi:phage-related protein
MADADFSVKAIISAQTSQFEKGIKNAQSSVNSLSSSISNITNLVKKAFAFTGVAIGTKAIVDFGKSCVQSANEAVKTFNILDNTVKATGADAWTSTQELEKMSKELSNSTNYSVTEIQQMQSVLLGFTNITGEAFDGASEAVLDMATVMGMDLTSAVQTIGKALDDPITGLDSLRRQGFKFTDEQKAELAQLVKNGKQYEAQKIILDTLSTSYGGAAKAGQDSFAKQRHAVENLQDTIGGKLIPVMQVFAENNSKMINSLTDVISKMNFTPVVNVVTNLKKIFSDTFNTMSGYLRNVVAYVSDFISRFNFKPIISTLDGLLGGLSEIISKFKEMNSQRLEIFDKLKEALIDFSNSETFQNIVNFVNKIIDAVFFLWSEIQDIGMEIKDLVVNKIIEIWGKIKELFQNGQNALSESGQDIASWGDLFYNILNNAFRSFQDFFGMIKALIHGDWTVAWEYAKLTVMRVADNILDLISTIANAFPNLINGMIKELNKLITEINKVRGWFGKDPLGLISAFESVDLSKKSGLEDKIKEAEDKIQELTGKSADITIQNLEGVSTKFAGFTQHALGEIGKLTEGVATNSEKQKQYFTGTFSSTEDKGKSTYEAFSEWDSKLLQQRLEGLKEWSGKYHEIQLALIEEERKKAHDADKSGAETEKINAYYNKQIEKENKRHNKAIIARFTNILNAVKSITSKVFSFVSNAMSKIVSGVKSAVKSVVGVFSNIFGFITEAFKFDPSEFINTLLSVEDTILSFFLEVLPKIPVTMQNAFSSVAILIQTLINTINFDVISEHLYSTFSGIINTLPGIIEGFIKLIDGMINSISKKLRDNSDEIATKIGNVISVFVTSMPKLFEDVAGLISSFMGVITNTITTNKDKIAEGIANTVNAVIGTIPKLIQDAFNFVNGLLQVLGTAISTKKNEIAKGLTDIVSTFFNNLPDTIGNITSIVSNVLNVLVTTAINSMDSMSSGIGVALQKIGDLIPTVISSAISLASAFIAQGFPNILASVSQLIINVFNSLPSLLQENVPKVLDAILKLIPSVFSNAGLIVGNILSEIPTIITGVINGLSDFIANLDSDDIEAILKSIFDAVGSIVNGLIQNIGKLVTEFIPAMVKLVGELIKKLPEIFTSAVQGIGKGISNIGQNIVQGVKSVVGGVGDFFKNLFTGKLFATGTQSAPNGLAIVGEAGPELVRFRGGEQVLNSHNTQKALEGMGGTTINQNVTFNNLQDTTAFAMIQQLKQYNRQMAINGVI